MGSLEREMAPDLGTRQPSGLRKPAFALISAEPNHPVLLMNLFLDVSFDERIPSRVRGGLVSAAIDRKKMSAPPAPAHRSHKVGSLLLWMQARNE